MLGLYLATFAFGTVLIGTSLVLGGGDGEGDFDKDVDGIGDLDKDFDLSGDVDHDVDVDFDADLDAEADLDVDVDAELEAEGLHHDAVHALTAVGDDAAGWIWLPFFSLRFWSFGSAAFGATGLLLTLGSIPDLVGGTVSAATGTAVGTAAAWFFRQLKRDMVTGDTRLQRWVGEQATVVLAIRPGATGMIRVESAAGDLDLPATTRDRRELPRGSVCLIAGFAGRTADVTSLPAIAQDPDED